MINETNTTMTNLNYRILTSDFKVKYAGTGQDSWFNLEDAKLKVNRKNNETIYEYNKNNERLWEVL